MDLARRWSIAKNSKTLILALKFMSFLNSKAEVLELNKFQAKVPVRTDVTPADLGLAAWLRGRKDQSVGQQLRLWVDNSLSANVVNEFNKQLPLVLTGKMTPRSSLPSSTRSKDSSKLYIDRSTYRESPSCNW